MKKLLSIFLAVALLLSVCATSVLAFESADVVLSCGDITAYPGQTVEIPLVIEQNSGFCGLNLYFSYSSELTFVSLTNEVATLTCTSGLTTLWDGSENYMEIGTLALLRFAIPEDAAYNTVYTVEIHVVEAYDKELKDVAVSVIGGSVTVLCSHRNTTHIPGTPAGCLDGGYTDGIWCNDCETYISGHEEIPATGGHTDENALWEWDEEFHFHTCHCGERFDTESHRGGMASCNQRAVCEICLQEYGEYDSLTHTGGTVIENRIEPDHYAQTEGYSGDTVCLGCGETVAYGYILPAGEHIPGEDWVFDEQHHRKLCCVIGCGAVIADSEEEHFSTGDNVATCTKQAVCDVCGVFYGNPLHHDFSGEVRNEATLKADGTCKDEAQYYYACIHCGEIEHNDEHIFYGEKAPQNHVGGTILMDDRKPDHNAQMDGYTGDTVCLGCGEVLEYGQAIPAGEHIPNGPLMQDETYHWYTCGVENCGIFLDETKEQHDSTGNNVASCTTQAVCDLCGVPYGSLKEHDWSAMIISDSTLKSPGNCRDEAMYFYSCSECECSEGNLEHLFPGEKNPNVHCGHFGYTNIVEPDHFAQTDGYSGDYGCLDCGTILTYGYGIPVSHHEAAEDWIYTSTYHYQICRVEGCGAIIEGSEAEHFSTGDNRVTCIKQAVCDICGVSYGEVSQHDFTNTATTPDALKVEGNCCDEAEYYYSCMGCGQVEFHDGHTFYGERNPIYHPFDTELVNKTEPNHKEQIDGYSGDHLCSGCKEVLEYGSPLPPESHTPAEDWITDGSSHWKICGIHECGVIMDGSAEQHISTGDHIATCTRLAVCDICGVSYGESPRHNPGEWTVVKEPSASAEGEEKQFCTLCGRELASRAMDKLHMVADVNGDGKVNTLDYALLKRHVLGTLKLEDERLKRADVNGDGKVNTLDYVLAKRIVLGTYKP